MLIRSGPVKSRRNLVNAVSEHWRPPVFTHDSTWAQRKRAALRRFFDLQAGSIWKDLKKELSAASGKVLDVGCGAQIYKSLLPDHVSYIGIDTLDAKARFGYEVPNTLYFSGETWPVEDQSIDLVLCTEVLEHIQVPRLFLSEANRCLKPGGCTFCLPLALYPTRLLALHTVRIIIPVDRSRMHEHRCLRPREPSDRFLS